MSWDLLSLSGDLRRDHALETVLASSTIEPDEDAELCLNAQAVASIDVVAATATRMRIGRHLREHPGGTVTIWLPTGAAAAARYADVLHPLPDAARVSKLPDAEAPAHFTLLPATAISDDEEARLAGEAAFDACRAARISRQRARYISAAVTELADNALVHAATALDPPVVAVTSFGRERIVEVAVTDAGTAISEAPDPPALVRLIPGNALAGHHGFLSNILRQGHKADVEVVAQVLAGTARLLWTATSHRTERRRYVPGTTVIARIRA